MPKKTKKKTKPAKKKVVAKKPVKRKAAKKVVRKKVVARKQKAAPKPKKAKAAAPQKPKKEVIAGTLLGPVEDYYSHVSVIALTLQSPIAAGDTIRVKGHTTDLTQAVESMQINHAVVTEAKKGDAVGIKVNDKCRKGDKVYKV